MDILEYIHMEHLLTISRSLFFKIPSSSVYVSGRNVEHRRIDFFFNDQFFVSVCVNNSCQWVRYESGVFEKYGFQFSTLETFNLMMIHRKIHSKSSFSTRCRVLINRTES